MLCLRKDNNMKQQEVKPQGENYLYLTVMMKLSIKLKNGNISKNRKDSQDLKDIGYRIH